MFQEKFDQAGTKVQMVYKGAKTGRVIASVARLVGAGNLGAAVYMAVAQVGLNPAMGAAACVGLGLASYVMGSQQLSQNLKEKTTENVAGLKSVQEKPISFLRSLKPTMF